MTGDTVETLRAIRHTLAALGFAETTAETPDTVREAMARAIARERFAAAPHELNPPAKHLLDSEVEAAMIVVEPIAYTCVALAQANERYRAHLAGAVVLPTDWREDIMSLPSVVAGQLVVDELIRMIESWSAPNNLPVPPSLGATPADDEPVVERMASASWSAYWNPSEAPWNEQSRSIQETWRTGMRAALAALRVTT